MIEGCRSILLAAFDWRTNPLTSRVNRWLWGSLWPGVLLLLVATGIAIDFLLPPFSKLMGLAPPLIALTFLPDIVRDLVFSVPALFAFVVVWRTRRLRASAPADWSDRDAMPDFGARFFDAAALPAASSSTTATEIGPNQVPGPWFRR